MLCTEKNTLYNNMTQDYKNTSSWMQCAFVLLAVTLVTWIILLTTYFNDDGDMKFSLESTSTICTVKDTVLASSTCTLDSLFTNSIYECTKATIESQADGTKAFITILDSDFPDPLIGDESYARMSQHIASDWPNESNHTCSIRGNEVRFDVTNPLIYYTVMALSLVSFLALLCTSAVSIIGIVNEAPNETSNEAPKEAIDSTADALGYVIEIPLTSFEEERVQ